MKNLIIDPELKICWAAAVVAARIQVYLDIGN